ncbi:MAG: HEAT repeat domain-containing protein [Planctomycetaceae bacterium]|nr:HEAT repeat domain-containing protein [Planctomycetaceae bacterium]
MPRLLIVLLLTLLATSSVSLLAKVPSESEVSDSEENSSEDARKEAALLMEGFQIPEGFEAHVFATEPLLANPVCFTIDEQGRFYVAETHRREKGVTDNRGHKEWVRDDLSLQTVEERREMFRKYLSPQEFAEYGVAEDRIVQITDVDGDGIADESVVYAGGFRDVVEGAGAGVLALDGDVYYTCIPRMWKLRDTDGDNRADEKEALSDGYGVRVAFRGHDLHGLIVGPDNRIYFSLGDRGYNVITQEGNHLVRPDTGAVFRCERDGSHLEVFAYGLRNPQELAFDDYGNLFTCDNNSDSGDKARFVHIIQGGDTGWRMHFQYLSDRGPWNREKMWYPQNEDQPAYILPPIVNVADGPSGFVAYPGVGFSERYRNHFFLCDFRGTPGLSGVRSFSTKPKGASYEMVDEHQFIWSVLATDIDFGYDGSIYLTDWIDGWNGLEKGRIFKFTDKRHVSDAEAAKTVEWIAADYATLEIPTLTNLLDHADRRIRLRAQFELSRRKDVKTLVALYRDTKSSLFSRLHAIWGLGEIARSDKTVATEIRPALSDADPEVRAQAAKVLGEAADGGALEGLIKLTVDESPRVQMMATLALAQLKLPQSTPAILTLLIENDDQDPILRHAGVMTLTANHTPEELARLGTHSAKSVRMASLLALRRQLSPQIAQFLKEEDLKIVTEAARAIHDEPILDVMPELASLNISPETPDALARRIINANLIVGDVSAAKRLLQLAANSDYNETWRTLAFDALDEWAAPDAIDAVDGDWFPKPPREASYLTELIRPHLPTLLTESDTIRTRTVQLATIYKMQEILPELRTDVGNAELSEEARVTSLKAVFDLNEEEPVDLLLSSLHSESARLRTLALNLLAERLPEAAAPYIEKGLASKDHFEQQQAVRMIAHLNSKQAGSLLLSLNQQWEKQELPSYLELEVAETTNKILNSETEKLAELSQSFNVIQDALSNHPLKEFAIAQAGGDIERGRELFHNNNDLSCLRCHKVDKKGGEVGPDLTRIGKEKTPDYLVEAIAFPNNKVAKGFESAVIVTEEGKIEVGIVRNETDEEIELIKADGTKVTINKEEIDEKTQGKSAMPEDLIKKMSLEELRDLVAYLKSLEG